MREEKQLLLDEVQNHLKKNDAFLIMRYKGLTANKANEFRGDLAKKGGFVEIVRKRIGREAHLRGNDLVIDTSQIKHVDVLAEATEIEKLIGSGAFSVNGVLRLLGRPTINEPWADIHHITKNFMPLEEALKAATGGTSK